MTKLFEKKRFKRFLIILHLEELTECIQCRPGEDPHPVPEIEVAQRVRCGGGKDVAFEPFFFPKQPFSVCFKYLERFEGISFQCRLSRRGCKAECEKGAGTCPCYKVEMGIQRSLVPSFLNQGVDLREYVGGDDSAHSERILTSFPIGESTDGFPPPFAKTLSRAAQAEEKTSNPSILAEDFSETKVIRVKLD